MDLSRLPSRRYVDEDAGAAGRQQRGQREAPPPHQQQRQQQQQGNGHHATQQQQQQGHQQLAQHQSPSSFIPPSQLLQHQQNPAGMNNNTTTTTMLPPLSSQLSTISGSTKYSPGIDGLSSIGGDYKSDGGFISPTDTTSYSRQPDFFRDKEGNAYHPSVTFAPSPSDGGNNGSSSMPTVSFRGGGESSGSVSGGHLHPGMGNRRGSGRNAEEGGYSGADFKRKRSLVRPERERVNPDGRNFHYAQHSAAFQAENGGRVGISNTGYGPNSAYTGLPYGGGQGGIASYGLAPGMDGRPGLRRGKSILAREEGMAHESGLNFIKRGATLRRNNNNNKKNKESYGTSSPDELLKGKRSGGASNNNKKDASKPALTPWMIYCYIITFFLPGVFLKALGYKTLDRRRAFREKLGLLSVIATLMGGVGFLTFGFTDAVCGNQALRFRAGSVQAGSMIFHGYDYSMDQFKHPAASGVETNSNPLYSDWNAGGKDGSFMFQNVNANCKGLITRASGSAIPEDANGNLGWYFPCNLNDQFSSLAPNKTDYVSGRLCHTNPTARAEFAEARDREVIGMKWEGPVYYTWDNITNSTRNLGVYKSSVLDFSLFRWLDKEYVNYPPIFDTLAAGNTSYEGRDSTMQLVIAGNRTLAECMEDIIRVGFVDSKTIGCVVADIVLYVSLVFILSVVIIKFAMAVIYSWFFGRRLGAFKSETKEERHKRIEEVERWTKDIYRPAPSSYRPNVKNARKSYLPTTSRFTAPVARPYSTYADTKRQSTFGSKNLLGAGMRASPPDTPVKGSRSNSSLPLSSMNMGDRHSRASSFDMVDALGKPCPFPLDINVVPQPAPDYQPFKFPLAHTMLLVTAYSESVEGLRTTLDSLATSDYPNSHKFILVIADGLVRGSGNDHTTPDIVLGMMKDLITPQEEVEAVSYVAVADGRKRHNMAKVYAGYYDYDNETVESSKQQRVPMILIAKCGTPLEAHDAKPGNRGKRDSQVLLMAFLQKVMFDERMTNFEYEFFNAIWRVTGVSADNYEHVLMVDADTKVFPDAVTRMVACMVQDVDIMGLCGETKIANKSETWVTMIQVFEYYISHHQTKAFESMWGGVTCLPGCFSMYRIKAPKGADGYWVPILANPDIVEHYSENVVDNLHKKNLLLLGEDRYLTTLMLKTFPKRKMMFCPQAYCKTVVPDTFRVLLSQRRRWINSTIHNLFELLLVRDLCGTFCFSMQFVVFMELVGTLVLPAAIAFTIYILALTCDPRVKEKPIIPLILLAAILGLPGLLIIITSRKIAYVGWMVIYLFSLPIWNFVLPAYAYFNMDDFSWGATRKIHGEGVGATHDDKEGEFDSQSIIMKRWNEWERERRWKNGTRSRDSTYDVLHRAGSPYQASNRNSVISTTDTFVSQPQDPFFRGTATPSGYSSGSPGGARRQVDNVQVLELPAPLAVTHQPQGFQHIPSETEVLDSADPNALHNYEASPYQSSSSENFHPGPSPVPRTEEDYPRYPSADVYDSDVAEREAILGRASIDPYDSIRSPSTDTAPQPFPAMTESTPQPRRASSVAASGGRGVSLYDPGPVSAPDGAVRIVKRNRRSSATTRGRQSLGEIPPPRQSDDVGPPVPTSPQDYTLPPGAAPRR